jgi:hypothetical protein
VAVTAQPAPLSVYVTSTVYTPPPICTAVAPLVIVVFAPATKFHTTAVLGGLVAIVITSPNIPRVVTTLLAFKIGTVTQKHGSVISAETVAVGTVQLLTVVVKVAVVAHCPASGVKVYVAPVVLSIVAGLHVPVIAGVLVELAGNVGAVVPLQKAGIAAKVGVVFGVTVVVKVAVVAHCPASGVKVYVAPVVLSIVAGLHVPCNSRRIGRTSW